VGGGAASSIQVQGDNVSELDFGAVQRGDAEMEQKMKRALRACLELDSNLICGIHDQGAGGSGKKFLF
jgi:phosphoribosylformylglycinamidine synthase